MRSRDKEDVHAVASVLRGNGTRKGDIAERNELGTKRLHFSLIGLSLGGWIYVVTQVGAAHPEDDILRDVGGMVRDALEIPSNKKRIARLTGGLRSVVHGLVRHVKCFLTLAIHHT